MANRSKRSVLRTIRIPNSLDSEISNLCNKQQCSYSACLISVLQKGISYHEDEKGAGKVVTDAWRWVRDKK